MSFILHTWSYRGPIGQIEIFILMNLESIIERDGGKQKFHLTFRFLDIDLFPFLLGIYNPNGLSLDYCFPTISLINHLLHNATQILT